MTIGGTVALSGASATASTSNATSPIDTVEIRAELGGQVADRGPARAVQLRLDATASPARIEIRSAEATAGDASATLSGVASRDTATWHLVGRTALTRFDPAAWLGDAAKPSWRAGPHRLNGDARFDLTLPETLAGAGAAAAAGRDPRRGLRHARAQRARRRADQRRGQLAQ